MVNKYYQKKTTEKLQNEEDESFQNLSKEEKDKRRKPSKIDIIKIFLKKKHKKNVSVIVNVIKIFLKKKKKRNLSI